MRMLVLSFVVLSSLIILPEIQAIPIIGSKSGNKSVNPLDPISADAAISRRMDRSRPVIPPPPTGPLIERVPHSPLPPNFPFYEISDDESSEESSQSSRPNNPLVTPPPRKGRRIRGPHSPLPVRFQYVDSDPDHSAASSHGSRPTSPTLFHVESNGSASSRSPSPEQLSPIELDSDHAEGGHPSAPITNHDQHNSPHHNLTQAPAHAHR
ncbi:hypothetical protein H0H93_004693 [Arthromyces matolae]|nr:hypothetical protein H0H93_004693 [Arthromyces matolae]